MNSILFADDTNLFYSHKNIRVLFKIVNEELVKIDEWFKANKLSLNLDKTQYLLFHKASKRDDLPLKLPTLLVNNKIIKRNKTMKFLGVILDEKGKSFLI